MTLRKTVWGLRLQSLVAVLIVIFVFPSPRPLPWAWDGCDIIESFVFGRHLTHGLTVSAFYGYDRWQLQAIYRTLLVVAPSITGHFTTTATISFGSSPLSAIYMRRESGQQWFRKWLVAYSAPSHYLNQIWVIVNSHIRHSRAGRALLRWRKECGRLWVQLASAVQAPMHSVAYMYIDSY